MRTPLPSPRRFPPGTLCDQRYLIVNADDFGLSTGINQGILKCHTQGVITSASLMVRGAAASEAAADSRSYPGLSVGLHLDLGEWICADGAWQPIYEVVPTEDAVAVKNESKRQLEVFRELLGRDPTHLDSHQHVHRQEPIRRLVRQMGQELQIPVRHFSADIRYCGDFYGQTGDGDALPDSITTSGLVELIEGLPQGVTEIGCHPGYADDLNTMYRVERRQEMETLCSEVVRRAIMNANVSLISFSQLEVTRNKR